MGFRIHISVSIAAVALLASLVVAAPGCRRQASGINEEQGFPMRTGSDCMPDITLTDQHGRKVPLSSLKGEPALFDFIYTTCPGPCLLLTSRMKRVANQLGPRLGTQARLVSITVNPEHDRPEQLLAYAKKFDADMKGWLFLTGTPQQIDGVMKRFNLVRKRKAHGTVDHVLEFFLVGGDGRALLQYLGNKANPQLVAKNIEQVAAGETITTSEATDADR